MTSNSVLTGTIRNCVIVAVAAVVAMLSGCSAADRSAHASGSEADGDGPLSVTVSIIPQQTFIQAIGGDRVHVTVMVPPGSEPATYEPTARQVTGLARSDAYFSIDVPFERSWMPRFRSANRDMTVVDTTQGIDRDTFANGEPDPHIWLDPKLVLQQAKIYAQALEKLDPTHADDYRAGLASFTRTVKGVDDDLHKELAPFAGQSFMIFHPVLNYFARAYDLTPVNIEVGGDEPSAADMQRLIETGRKQHISVVFVEPQFSQRAARTIADQLGAKVITLDPLAADWAANMREIGRSLATSFPTS